jgi:hypothetical protein
MFTTNYHENLIRAVRENAAYRSKYRVPLHAMSNDDTELSKYYTFDELGHIMVASTSKDTDKTSPEVTQAFQKVKVFMGAWTKALTQKSKTLFDFDAITQILSKSGFFVNTQKEERTFNSTSTSVSLDTSIIQNVLSGGVTGGGLQIAKRTLAAIGSQIKASYAQKDTKKEISHLLFIIDSMMNVPIVSISLFHVTVNQMEWVQKTNCSQVDHSSVSFSFSGDDYLFVDPDEIEKYSPEFKDSPDFDALVAQLAGYIKQ